MDIAARPSAAAPHPSPPTRPFDVVVVGAGRVGGSYARALERAGHRIVGMLGRSDDPTILSKADVVVLAVPDDALGEAAGLVARLGRPGAVVVHSCGLHGLVPLRECGPHIAAIHPAAPIASNDQDLDGVVFGVTCPDDLRGWCDEFVADLGGRATFIDDDARPRYHAALVMASNLPVALAGDAAEILGGHEILVPLMQAMLDNIERHGPDAALTGPVVRGDVGTIRAHLNALPPAMIDSYVAGTRRAVDRARSAGRLSPGDAHEIERALDEATVTG